MRTSLALASLVLVVASVLAAQPPSAAAATCQATGFIRDGIDMTAAMINPTATVSGDVDATGCNIGVYYSTGSGSVNAATVHGANYFGVVANGDNNPVTVNVTNSTVNNIGETPFNGTQHGVAIYYRALATGTAAGLIQNNTVSAYQKGGIVTNGAVTATITGNTVTGLGRVDFIAQNGIQVGYGANASVQNNIVSGNAYT